LSTFSVIRDGKEEERGVFVPFRYFLTFYSSRASVRLVKAKFSLRRVFPLDSLICHSASALPWVAEPLPSFECAFCRPSRWRFLDKFLD
jgi:hypothetical protein